MHVVGVEKHRNVRDDLVEHGCGGFTVDGIEEPAAAAQHGRLGAEGFSCVDQPLSNLREIACVGEGYAAEPGTEPQQVYVRVDESGEDEAAFEVLRDVGGRRVCGAGQVHLGDVVAVDHHTIGLGQGTVGDGLQGAGGTEDPAVHQCGPGGRGCHRDVSCGSESDCRAWFSACSTRVDKRATRTTGTTNNQLVTPTTQPNVL